MGVGRPIDRVSGMHGFWTGGGGCILHQSDVKAELHGKPTGYLDAGVGDHADNNDVADAELLQLYGEWIVGWTLSGESGEWWDVVEAERVPARGFSTRLRSLCARSVRGG